MAFLTPSSANRIIHVIHPHSHEGTTAMAGVTLRNLYRIFSDPQSKKGFVSLGNGLSKVSGAVPRANF